MLADQHGLSVHAYIVAFHKIRNISNSFLCQDSPLFTSRTVLSVLSIGRRYIDRNAHNTTRSSKLIWTCFCLEVNCWSDTCRQRKMLWRSDFLRREGRREDMMCLIWKCADIQEVDTTTHSFKDNLHSSEHCHLHLCLSVYSDNYR